VKTVLIRLEGPLQAWSTQGKLGIRDTEREPTKSGVLGLVGAALGMPRDNDAGLAALASLKMGVRVDRAGTLLHDYHTAGGGKFRGREYYVLGTSDCVPTHRYYLQGASFVAALEGDDALMSRIAEALRGPRYALFLGRRSCPPSVPLLIGVVEGTGREALAVAPLAREPDRGPYRLVLESPSGEGDIRYDVPLSFAQIERRYRTRYVTTEWVAGPAQREVGV
jgi:CRISPR system Cascade subunit CasD